MSSSLSSGAYPLSQEKAETYGETDLPLFSHLKRLESYPTQMSDASLSHSFIPPSRLFSGRVLVAFRCIPADKPNRFARVEGVL